MGNASLPILTKSNSPHTAGHHYRFGMDNQSILNRIKTFDGVLDAGIDRSNTIHCRYDSNMLDMRDISSFLDYTPRDSAYLRVDGKVGEVYTLRINQDKPLWTQQELKKGFNPDDDIIHVDRTTFTTSFSQATARDIRTQGVVREIKPGLHVGDLVDDQNQLIHFGFEDLSKVKTEHNVDQWYKFFSDSSEIADDFNDAFKGNLGQVKSTGNAPYYQLKYLHDCIHHELESAMLGVPSAQNTAKIAALMDKIPYAAGGQLLKSEYANSKKYVIYASTKPVTDFVFNKPNKIYDLNQFLTRTGHIAMFVTGTSNATRALHRGIFKPAVATLNNLQADFRSRGMAKGGLSMATHLFGMQCFKALDLPYFSFSPIKSMYTVFKESPLPQQRRAVFIGQDEIKQARLTKAQGVTCSTQDEEKKEIPVVINLDRLDNPLWEE